MCYVWFQRRFNITLWNTAYRTKYLFFREANTLQVVDLRQCNIKKFQYEEGFMQSHWSEAQAQFLINERNDETLQKAWKAWLEFLYTSERLWSECEQYFVVQSKQVKEHLATFLTYSTHSTCDLTCNLFIFQRITFVFYFGG